VARALQYSPVPRVAYNLNDNSPEASPYISRAWLFEICIAEVTSDRICLSPFTKDNRGCGFMNATLTQISVRREAVKRTNNAAQEPLTGYKRLQPREFSALGVVTVTCYPSGDYAKCGVSSRA